MKLIYTENYDQQIKEVNDYNQEAKKYNKELKIKTRPLRRINDILLLVIGAALILKGGDIVKLIHKLIDTGGDITTEPFYWIGAVMVYLGILYGFIYLSRYGFPLILKKEKLLKEYTERQQIYEKMKLIADSIVFVDNILGRTDDIIYEYIDEDGNLCRDKLISNEVKIVKNTKITDMEFDLDKLQIRIPYKVSKEI